MGELKFIFKDCQGNFTLSNMTEDQAKRIQKLVREANGKGYLEQEGLYTIRMDSIILISYSGE